MPRGPPQELLVGLGDLEELQSALAASGLAELGVERLSRLVHALCEQLLKLDRSVAQIEGDDPSKARLAPLAATLRTKAAALRTPAATLRA